MSASDIYYFRGEKVEDIISYKPGGFHPVHLGNAFPSLDATGEPRYRVLQKLGSGAFATVWLAEDMSQAGRAVAMKIPFAVPTGQIFSREVSVLKSLAANAKSYQHPGHHHILALQDHFQISGPNGIHDALVTDILVPLELVRFVKLLNPRRISYEILLGLEFLHQHEIFHGDLHTNNVAFKLATLQALSANDWLAGIQDPSVIPLVSRKYQGPNPSAPLYVVESADSEDFLVGHLRAATHEQITTVIIDFGNACRRSDTLSSPCSPLAYQPPEVTFKHVPLGTSRPSELDEFDLRMKSDIWSLGCTIAEIVSGSVLFGRVWHARDLIDKMIAMLGPLPSQVYHSMDPPPYLDVEGGPQCIAAENWWSSLKDAQFASLLRQMVQYEPTARPRTEDLATHPWFEDATNSRNIA